MAREAQSTTGIGMGIAIPHGKSNAVKKTSIAFGRSERGVDFQSLDSELAHLFFLIAVPEDAKDEHLRLLSQLSRKLVHQEVRQRLMETGSKEEVLKILEM
jgi:fructose-specific phosphotransferase system IIA component